MQPDDQQAFAEHITNHYEDPYHRGPLESSTHQCEGTNPVCNDTIQLELRIDEDNNIVEAWFDGDGCVISQASASMLMEKIESMTCDEVRVFSANEMLALLGTQLPANRQRCCLLSWRILQDAIQTAGNDDDELGPNFGGPSLSEEC